MSTNINIGDLVRRVANSSADDHDTLFELQGNLYDLKGAIPTVNHPELGFMLDAASDLMRYLADGQQPTAQAMLTMLTRLLVNAECTMYRNLEVLATGEVALAPEGSAVPTKPPHTLKLNAKSAVSGDAHDLSSMRLGQFLVQLGLVSAEQVAEAMEVQTREKIRLGEALAQLGHVMPQALKDALSLRVKMQTYGDSQDGDGTFAQSTPLEMNQWQNSLLGTILVGNHTLTQEQLDKGLAIQKATGMRLGEALVQHGFCDWRQVRNAIQTQERLRHASNPVVTRGVSLQKIPVAPLPKRTTPRVTPPSRIPPPPV